MKNVIHAAGAGISAVCLFLLLFPGCTTQPSIISPASPASGTGEGAAVLPDVPEAEPGRDGVREGLYKGVLTTPEDSGYFAMYLRNSEKDDIRLDGSYNRQSFSIGGTEEHLEAENRYRYRFTGTTDGGGVEIEFETEIDVSGIIEDRNTAFLANGENVSVNMMKETSKSLVRVFEGVYTGSSGGNWNFLTKDGTVSGFYAGDGAGRFDGILNTVTGAVRVWGRDGNMLAAGGITAGKPAAEASGVWKYETGAGFSESSAVSAYPQIGKSADIWKGTRTR